MKRSFHDLSFTHNLSMDMGTLVPLAAIDVLPGDTLRAATSLLARVAPLQKPIMHPVEIRVHNWFVPNRIIWDDWEEFIVGNEQGHNYPTYTINDSTQQPLYDHMGVEPHIGLEVDALPIRAYNKIFNEFYRDQDLVTERDQNNRSLANIAWAKDYFTTARANPQQGAAVEVGFSAGEAPIKGLGGAGAPSGSAFANYRETDATSEESVDANSYWSAGNNIIREDPDNLGYPKVFADLSNATGGIDINELRNAISLQRIAEAREFFGSRYVDYLRYYGINPRDGRLDRPEYLGGGRQEISFSEVLATSESTSVDVGDMFGHGIAGLRSKPYRKMFEEHGWMISLMSVRPKGIYQNGVPRRFLRRDPTDFWHRELELLPWQEITNKEIYAAGTDDTFGYVPRYDEYRETSSYVSGTFRGGSEEDWTLSREFTTQPTLNESFITCKPTDRVYSDSNMPELLVTARNNIKGKRLVSANARMSNRAGL